MPETLAPYLQPGGLPQVFNFQLILGLAWRAAEFRTAIDSALAVTGGILVRGESATTTWPARRAVTWLDVGFTPDTVFRLIALGDRNAAAGARRARAAALVLLALPGSAYIYQGEELGLPEVTDIPDDARQDPRFFRIKGEFPGRDGCRVPLPWSASRNGFGFSRTGQGSSPAEPAVAAPAFGLGGGSSLQFELADEHSTVNLYRSALRRAAGIILPCPGPGIRAGRPGPGRTALARPGRARVALLRPVVGLLVLAANLGPAPVPLPADRDAPLASGPVARGSLPPDTAVWLDATLAGPSPHSAFIQQIGLFWRSCRR